VRTFELYFLFLVLLLRETLYENVELNQYWYQINPFHLLKFVLVLFVIMEKKDY
jgi:hypothetical protein